MYRLTITKTIINKITVLCIILLFPLIGMGQRTLEGRYCEEVGMFADDINYFEFYSDGFFVYEKHSDFGNYKATGRYKLTYDSLFLSFTQPPESVPSPSLYSEPIIDTIAKEPYQQYRFTGYTIGFEVRVKKNHKLLKFYIKENDFFHPTVGVARYNLCEGEI